MRYRPLRQRPFEGLRDALHDGGTVEDAAERVRTARRTRSRVAAAKRRRDRKIMRLIDGETAIDHRHDGPTPVRRTFSADRRGRLHEQGRTVTAPLHSGVGCSVLRTQDGGVLRIVGGEVLS